MSDGATLQSGAWARLKRRLRIAYFVLSAFALVTIVAIACGVQFNWISLGVQSPLAVEIVAAGKDVTGWLLRNLGEIVRAGSFALLAYALFKAAMNLETIYNIVNAFNTARSPIAQLSDAVEKVRGMAAALGSNMKTFDEASRTLNEHAPVIAELNSKLADLSEQVFQLKIDAASASAEDEPDGDPDAPTPLRKRVREDAPNWEELRELWRRNIERLESLIRDSLSGPRKKKYENYSRKNYAKIIDKLFEDQVLSGTARDYSKKLHDTFMSHRRTPVTDEVLSSVRILDEQLAHEFKTATVGPIRAKAVEEVF